MSTEEKKVQGSEMSDAGGVEQVTCCVCGKEFNFHPDRVWHMPLKVIEAVIRKEEGFARWARESDLKLDHAMCGSCGHLAREQGARTYKFSDQMKVVNDRKIAAEAKRCAEQKAADAAAASVLKMKLGNMYDLSVTTEQPRENGRFVKGKKVKTVRVEHKNRRHGATDDSDKE